MSAPEGKKQRDYSRYNQMSTAELEQLLRLDFQASEDGDSDLDGILYISDLLTKRNEPSDSDAAWEQFQTKYRPYADGHSLYDPAGEDDTQAPEAEQASSALPAIRPGHTQHLRRLAILAAVLAACLLCGMAVAQAAGLDVFGAIARWTDETFQFVPMEPGSSSNFQLTEEMEQNRASLQEFGMEDRFPTWQPDGFVPRELNITELNASINANIPFLGEDRSYTVSIVHYTSPVDHTGVFEKDDTPVEEYVHNGQTFYILSNLDTLTATAYDEGFMTIIAGMLTREEIKAIIDSIPGP